MAKRNMSMTGAAVPMEPGERRWSVTLQQLTETTSDSGFPREPWTTLATNIKMRKLDAKGDERFKSDHNAGYYETQWEMGYRPDMDPDLLNVSKTRRVLYQGRVHDIVYASVIGQREGIELLTIAGTGGAL